MANRGSRRVASRTPRMFYIIIFIYSTKVYKNEVNGLRRRMEMTGTEGGRARWLETRRVASRGLGMFLYIHFFFSLLHLVVKYDDDDDRAPADASVSFFSSSSTDFFADILSAIISTNITTRHEHFGPKTAGY